MSIKEQIRAEIERLEGENNCGTSDFIESKRIAYKQVKEALETLIPELKESRDEQIRKAIIKSLDMPFPEDNLPGTDVTYKEAVAWLEKQKETSKAIEAVERIDKYIDENLANAHDMKDSDPDKKYYLGWDDALGKMAGILQDVYSGEKQNHDGKKWITPAELNRLLTLRYEAGFNDGVRGEMKKQEDHFRDDTKMVEQKPAEWSEEDEHRRQQAINALDRNGYYVLVDWLKSLRPSWKPSVEQMNTLLSVEGILRSLQYSDKAKILASIYEQLKQLYL